MVVAVAVYSRAVAATKSTTRKRPRSAAQTHPFQGSYQAGCTPRRGLARRRPSPPVRVRQQGLLVKIGDEAEKGQPVGRLYGGRNVEKAKELVLEALEISDTPAGRPPAILESL